jgi:hypothetical protein
VSYSYAKLFTSITESTVWSEPPETRCVWVTLLAKCDQFGRVFGAVPGLARLSNVSLEACEIALRRFHEPDKYSRTPDHDGRRIETIVGGWRLLNYKKYRDLEDDEKKLAQAAERQRKFRERRAEEQPDLPIDGNAQGNAVVTEKASSNAKSNNNVSVDVPVAEVEKKNIYTADFEAAWKAYPARDGDNPKSAAFRCWGARLADGHSAQEMITGSERYAAWCVATGKTGTETVMQAKRFFGPDKPFLNTWEHKPLQRGNVSAPVRDRLGTLKRGEGDVFPEDPNWMAVRS